MPVVFKNPDLSDYFVERKLRRTTPLDEIAPITDDYEAGKVVVFPKFKLQIDHKFWSRLPSDAYPLLKKLSSAADPDDFTQDSLLDKRLKAVGLPPELEEELRAQMHSVYAQVLPIYQRLFGDYRFGRRQVVWRLNTIRNENLHVDTYKEVFPEHFARLFINLDSQPRIWMTSFNSDEMYERFGSEVDATVMRGGQGQEIFGALNRQAFGGLTAVWWDRQPRHMVYFDPGEMWCVDSRQVSHQVFYGRRAVSFDFFVDPASMHRPERHYLALAESYRQRAVAGA